MVIYEDKKFNGKVLGKKKSGEIKVCCLEKSQHIAELKDFQRLGNSVFYTKVFNPEDGSGSITNCLK